jgi:hypothetical protein
MTVPNVVHYLREHSFAHLEEEHGVCARPDSRGTKRPKFSLNYDMIMSKAGDPLVAQCRGLIVRPIREIDVNDPSWKDLVVGDVEVVAWPMNRFYNNGDINACQIDWSTAEVQEKLDGTMCIVYWDSLHEEWCIATRSVPEADLPISNGIIQHNMTFSELFCRAFLETWRQYMFASDSPYLDEIIDGMEAYDLLCDLKKEFTYVFELTSPYNRIVVKYTEPGVTLLAMRHTASGVEKKPAQFKLNWIPITQTWKLNDFMAIEAFVNCVDPSKLEGAVVVDHTFARVKVKNKAWVLSSRAKDLLTVSRRAAVEAIFSEQIDDVIPLLEDDVAEKLVDMQDAIRSWLKSVDKNYASWFEQAGGNRKTFAGFVLASEDVSAPYFSLWDKRAANAREWAKNSALAGRLGDRFIDGILNKYDHGNLTRING